jgi:hypothetical protein
MLSLTLVYNFFTNIFPFFLSKTLPADGLGFFRVIASLVQSATSFFPLNVKAIFVIFVRGGGQERHYATVMTFSLLYFAAGGLACFAASAIWPNIYPYTALACSLPTLYWAVMTERYLLALRRIRYVRLTNLVVGLAFFAAMLRVEDVREAVFCYATGFAVYAGILLCGVPSRFKLPVLAWVCGLPPVVAFFFWESMLPSGGYLAGCIAIALYLIRFTATDLRALREAL